MVILYFQSFLKYTGSIPGALHLAQVLYWYGKMKRSFFKPIKVGRKYANTENQEILSWCEELGVSYEVLHANMKQTCTRLKRGQKYDLRDCGLILYWKGSYGQIYFIPNYPRLSLLPDLHAELNKNYPDFKNWFSHFSKLENPGFEIVFDQIENWDMPVSYIKEITNESKNNINNEKDDFPITGSVEKPADDEKEKTSAKKEKPVLPFSSPQFAEIWAGWKIYLERDHGIKLSFYNEQAALKQLSDYDEQFSINLIQTAIANRWKSYHFSDTPQKYLTSKFKNYGNSSFRKTSNAFKGTDYAYSKYRG